jgi:hypothetical protein
LSGGSNTIKVPQTMETIRVSHSTPRKIFSRLSVLAISEIVAAMTIAKYSTSTGSVATKYQVHG